LFDQKLIKTDEKLRSSGQNFPVKFFKKIKKNQFQNKFQLGPEPKNKLLLKTENIKFLSY
jgi:hypothetical protein